MSIPLICTIGPFPFLLETILPEGINRNSTWRWQELHRLGRDPYLQYLGANSENIEVYGIIIPNFEFSPGRYVTTFQLHILREIANLGIPLPFIDGIGEIFGFYVITSISDNTKSFLPGGGGKPAVQKFSIKMKSYIRII